MGAGTDDAGAICAPFDHANGVIVYKRLKLRKRPAPDAACPLSHELLARLATISTTTCLT